MWARWPWHTRGLDQCIADFTAYRKPDLNIVDAYRVMMDNGPRGTSVDDVAELKYQVISTDIVAADAAAAEIFKKGMASKIKYIGMAHNMKLGNKNLKELNIKRITL